MNSCELKCDRFMSAFAETAKPGKLETRVPGLILRRPIFTSGNLSAKQAQSTNRFRLAHMGLTRGGQRASIRALSEYGHCIAGCLAMVWLQRSED